MRPIRNVRHLGWLALALLAPAACQRAARQEARTELGAAGMTPLDSVTAQRDSLFAEVANNARLMNEINAELGKVKDLKESDAAAESPISSARDNLVYKVQQVTARLTTTEQRLSAARRQLREASTRADSLSTRVTELEHTLADVQALVESQKTTITELTDRVTALEVANLALRDSVDTIRAHASTAYYVIGTKDELIQRGIIEKAGGHRVLFIFGKAGQTLVPARNIDPTQFTPIDTRTVTDIPLPDSAAQYVIASRQDLEYLATPPDDHGKIKGTLQITQPDRFWLPSRFLIVVRS